MEDINEKAFEDELNGEEEERIEATEEEKKAFGLHKAWGVNKTVTAGSTIRPRNGRLVIEESNGTETQVSGAYDKPFPLLQAMRQKMITQGYGAKRLKIKYM